MYGGSLVVVALSELGDGWWIIGYSCTVRVGGRRMIVAVRTSAALRCSSSNFD